MIEPIELSVSDARARAGQRPDPDDRSEAPVRRLHRQVQPRPASSPSRVAACGSSPSIRRRRCRRTGASRSSPTAAWTARCPAGGRLRPRRSAPAAGQPRRSLRRDDLVDGAPCPQRARRDERRAVPLPDPGVRALHLRDGLLGGDREADLRLPPRRPLLDRASCAAGSRRTATASSRPDGERGRSGLGLDFQNAITAGRARRASRSFALARPGGCSSTRAPSRTRSATCSSSG